VPHNVVLLRIGITAEQFWDRSNRNRVLLAAAGITGAIALVDWQTLPYVSLGFLYLFPIMLISGFLPRRALVAVGIVCAVLSEAFSSLDSEGRTIRLIFEALAFTGCGLFVAELVRNRRLILATQRRLYALVETSPAAIVTVDQRGLIEVANQAAVELLVPAGASLAGQPLAAFVPELQNALRPDGTQPRASMQCEANRGNGESFTAEVWFSTFKEGGVPKLAAILADVTEELSPAITSAPSEAEARDRPIFNPRQVAVLQLLFKGLPNSEIASRLEMTVSAVKNTLQQIFWKAGVKNRSQMVRVVLERYRDLL
jgi:PAS domain S-box-containing protein